MNVECCITGTISLILETMIDDDLLVVGGLQLEAALYFELLGLH